MYWMNCLQEVLPVSGGICRDVFLEFVQKKKFFVQILSVISCNIFYKLTVSFFSHTFFGDILFSTVCC